MKIAILVGSTRPGRKGTTVAHDTLVRSWLDFAESVQVDLDLPARSMPRDLDL